MVTVVYNTRLIQYSHGGKICGSRMIGIPSHDQNSELLCTEFKPQKDYQIIVFRLFVSNFSLFGCYSNTVFRWRPKLCLVFGYHLKIESFENQTLKSAVSGFVGAWNSEPFEIQIVEIICQ